MNKEDMCEVVEIWQPVEEGGEAYFYGEKKPMKRIAMIVNGQPILLEKDFYMELRHISKTEADRIIDSKLIKQNP